MFHNPTAGAGGVPAEEVLAVLRGAGLTCHYHSTKDKRATAALAVDADVIVAAGGDGTVAKAVLQHRSRGIPIAILPLGGSNNIARSFGLTRAWQDIPSRWKDGKTRKLDIGFARGPWGTRRFVEAAGLGALASIIAKGSGDADPAEKIHRGRDKLREAIAKGKAEPVKLAIDGDTLADDVLLFEALNIRFVGPSLYLADGDPGDGLLDFVCVTPSHRREVEDWLVEPHDPPPKSIFLKRGRKLEIAWNGVPLHIDDHPAKPHDKSRKVTIGLDRTPATILVPANGESE